MVKSDIKKYFSQVTYKNIGNKYKINFMLISYIPTINSIIMDYSVGSDKI